MSFVGQSVNRVDGIEKVTGKAKYAADFHLPQMSYAVLLGSPIASGKITHLDTTGAEKAPGVILVLTHKNRDRLGNLPFGPMDPGYSDDAQPALSDETIQRTGQYVAIVVAESIQQARYAATLIDVQYEEKPFHVDIELPAETFFPAETLGEKLQISRGDVEQALNAADVRLHISYKTPNEHPCALEPHTSIVSWKDEKLTVYESTQYIVGIQAGLKAAFRLKSDQIHVISPFVGGMFGSKGLTTQHLILTAMASMHLNRPVKTVLSRRQVLTNVGHRTETFQKFEVGANRDGKITAMKHDVRTHSSMSAGKDDFIEQVSFTSRKLYDIPNYATTHEVVKTNLARPSWMRAPGEQPCQFAQESMLDELAYALKMDPVELRRRNDAKINPDNKLPFSSKHLVECYERGAERFGWSKRNPEPRSHRDGDTLIGWGMATATYPAYIMGATVRIRIEEKNDRVHATVSTAGSDVGTGLYTVMTLTTADALGLEPDQVTARLGDSTFPQCAVAGGSNLTASVTTAILKACEKVRKKLPALDELGFIEEEAKSEMVMGENEEYTFQSFGAHFAEVRINPEIGKIRVSRFVSVFDAGKIMSAKTARSQFIGGIVFGIGGALLEDLTVDTAHGKIVHDDLATYLVPVNSDIPEIDVSWIGEPDYNFNPSGCRGIGEIGNTGSAAAIANAVYHATGVRVREFPMTVEKILKK
jgi:xanthine dehydrogenase YagR molybdenum-binding subunit